MIEEKDLRELLGQVAIAALAVPFHAVADPCEMRLP